MKKLFQIFLSFVLFFSSSFAISSDGSGLRNRKAPVVYNFISDATQPLLEERAPLVTYVQEQPVESGSDTFEGILEGVLNPMQPAKPLHPCSVSFLTAKQSAEQFDAADKGDIKVQKEIIHRDNLMLQSWPQQAVEKSMHWEALKEAGTDPAIARFVFRKYKSLPWLDDQKIQNICQMIELKAKGRDPQALLTYSNLISKGIYFSRNAHLSLKCVLEAGVLGEAMGYYYAFETLNIAGKTQAAVRCVLMAAEAGLAIAQYAVFIAHAKACGKIKDKPNLVEIIEPTKEWSNFLIGNRTIRLHPEYGFIGKENTGIVMEYLEKSANQGFVLALMGLGGYQLSKFKRLRQQKSLMTAMNAFTKAAELGSAEAVDYIKDIELNFSDRNEPVQKSVTKAIE
ncbi:MAG: hypothetical protein KBB83_00085 [Alphaproteobacteria bacterium]|nr:hypothetical protein [Alphaproteobacteria bacterium]